MRKALVAVLLGAAAALLSCAAFARAGSGVELPPGVTLLQGGSGLLSLRAEKADLREVLRAISQATGVDFAVHEGVKGEVTTSFQDLWLPDGIRRVLGAAGADNYALEFEGDRGELVKVTVLPRGEVGVSAVLLG